MLKIVRQNKFLKDVQLAQKRGKQLKNLRTILELLVKRESLPARFRAHKLKGDYSQYWECHVEPDYLMIYYVEGDELHLVRLGTHSDLF